MKLFALTLLAIALIGAAPSQTTSSSEMNCCGGSNDVSGVMRALSLHRSHVAVLAVATPSPAPKTAASATTTPKSVDPGVVRVLLAVYAPLCDRDGGYAHPTPQRQLPFALKSGVWPVTVFCKDGSMIYKTGP